MDSNSTALPITEYLKAIHNGESGAEENLFELVYDTLRFIATKRLGRSAADELAFEPTELVHETWIRLGGAASTAWENRVHFFAAAAEAMRRTLVDNARSRNAVKRGGGQARREEIWTLEPTVWAVADELLDLDEALAALEAEFPDKAQVVKLKFFAGMTIDEIASLSGLSTATVERYWAFSKAWLYRSMCDHES